MSDDLPYLQTRDGRWRIEPAIIRTPGIGRKAWFRLVHDGVILHPQLALGELEPVLGSYGVDLADFEELPR